LAKTPHAFSQAAVSPPPTVWTFSSWTVPAIEPDVDPTQLVFSRDLSPMARGLAGDGFLNS
jgi:hypothetical protein